MPELSIDINDVLNRYTKTKCQEGKQIYDTIDCGDEAAEWFSQYIPQSKQGLRLCYHASSKPQQPVTKEDKQRWPKTTSDEHTGALHGLTSYMMINLESVVALNERLDEPVLPLQFRPNILFKGLPAYEEDKLRWVRIGEKTVFKYVQPCLRCIFTTINPDTAARHPNNEPLKTLKG